VPQEEHYELLAAVDSDVSKLMAEHKSRREHWYAHEIVPWERGRNYRAEPWEESQCTISPEARTSLVLNLLTEDNLPYYHSEIESHVGDSEALKEWNHLWTAEEGQHAIALRSYLLTSRNADPVELENDRLATMTNGYHSGALSPVNVFVYTSAQELATRVSHRNAGKITDDPVAYELMTRIAADENHHFMFYRGVVKAMLAEAPEITLQAILQELERFQMPGIAMPNFMRRAVEMAKAGVYNLRIHHDRVVVPVLRDWGIERLDGLSVKAQEIQEKLIEFPAQLSRKAEAFERRYGTATA